MNAQPARRLNREPLGAQTKNAVTLYKPNMIENPRVGVGIIIRKGDRVLLLRRKNVHGGGSWSTPGGHLDFSESPERW